MAHPLTTPPSYMQPVEAWHIVLDLQKKLAKETKTTVEAVKLITEHKGNCIFEAAKRAHEKLPHEGNWLDMAMACNAAPNKHARRLIEDHARTLWNSWIASLPAHLRSPPTP